MRLKTLTAPDMKQAMQLARDTLGDEAIIVSSTKLGGGKGVQVTIAVDDDIPFIAPQENDTADERPISNDNNAHAPFADAPNQSQSETPAPPRNHSPHRDSAPLPANQNSAQSIMGLFSYHSVPLYLQEKLLLESENVKVATGTSLAEHTHHLAQLLASHYRFDPVDFTKPGAYMLVGPAGAGKTTATTKIAAQLTLHNHPVILVSTDTKRAGGVEQLAAYADIMGLAVEYVEDRNELRQLLLSTAPDHTILIDSFGSNPYDFGEMKELGELASLQMVEPILVLPAGMDADEAEEIARTFSFLDITHLIIGKSDAARRYGAVLTGAYAADLAFSHYTDTASVSTQIQTLSANALAELLIRHKRDKYK